VQAAKTVLLPSEKMPADFVFVNFEVEKEGWNVYKLEDGSLLKTKFVLMDVIMERDFKEKIAKARTEKTKLRLGLGISSRNIVGIEAPLKLRGEPSTKAFTQEELRASVVNDDMDYEVVKETWNVYKLEEGIVLKARGTPINVAKTDKFDSRGLPICLVDSTVDIKVSAPKKSKA